MSVKEAVILAQGALKTEKQQTLSEDYPHKWVVIIYNDDFTSVEFVHTVLDEIFGKNGAEADKIIKKAESEGAAAVKYYTDPSMAEVAVAMVENYKEAHKQPHFKAALFRVSD